MTAETVAAPPQADVGLIPPMSPEDKIMTAISIVQGHIMAADSVLDGDAIWQGFHMQMPALEQAVRILIETLPDVENLK